MTWQPRPAVNALIAVGMSGVAAGVWLWLVSLPTARMLLPEGDVAFVHGRSTLPAGVALVLGLGGVGLAWLSVSWLASRLSGVPLRDGLGRAVWAYVPLLLLAVDGARLVLPLGGSLGPLTNPVVVLTHEGRWVIAAAVALALVVLHLRLRPARLGSLRVGPGALGRAAFLLVLVIYLAFLPRAVLVGPTGDEPDYLLLAHSLLVDRDFDLENNLARQDYRGFATSMTPHVRPGPWGGLYDTHRLGLPLVITPVYGLGLLTGWPVRVAVMGFLSLVAALVAARTVSWAASLTGHAPSALLAGLAAALSAPGFFYAYAVYPELLVALIVVEVLRRLCGARLERPWVVGVLIGSLPWFHEKFLLLTLVFTLVALWLCRGHARSRVALLVPLGVSALLQAGYYSVLYGRPFPFGAYPVLTPLAAIPNGVVGLWLDRDHGLLMLAPVYLLAFAGLAAFLRQQRRAAVIGLAAFLSVYAVVGTYREWWGGSHPRPAIWCRCCRSSRWLQRSAFARHGRWAGGFASCLWSG